MQVYVVITEGYTDCALVEAILQKYLGLKQYNNKNDMPECLQRQVVAYPGELGRLDKNDTPHFFYNDAVAVMVKTAQGITNIAKKVDVIVEAMELSEDAADVRKVMIICDADMEEQNRHRQELEQKMAEVGLAVNTSERTLSKDIVKVGYRIYAVPQQGAGAVEKVLLQILQNFYPELAECAGTYKDQIMGDAFAELRQKWASESAHQELYADKVQFGAAMAVLKPDRPIGYAVKDCLIKKDALERTLEIEEFKCLYEFLKEEIL